jgi:multiple sugar transport system permease protein
MPRSPVYIRRIKTIGFIFFLPALIYMVIFLLGPIITAIFISFTKYTILSPPRFVGFKNYARIFTMPSFWHSLRVTLSYIFVRLAVILVLAFFMGLVINQSIPFRGFYQAIYFMPYVFPLAVTAVIWRLFYRPFGLIEQLTSLVGIGYIPWLTSDQTALVAITITTVWSAAGYYSIVILAGLQTIPKEVLEAAVIDGAGNLRRLFSIIFPLLKPTLFYIVIVGTINSIRGFPPFLIMTGGGPGEATRVIGLMIYEYGFTMLKMGIASAMSVVLLAIILTFTMIQRRLYSYGGG